MALAAIVQSSELAKARRWDIKFFLGTPEEELRAQIEHQKMLIKKANTCIANLEQAILDNRELQKKNHVRKIGNDVSAVLPAP